MTVMIKAMAIIKAQKAILIIMTKVKMMNS